MLFQDNHQTRAGFHIVFSDGRIDKAPVAFVFSVWPGVLNMAIMKGNQQRDTKLLEDAGKVGVARLNA